MKYLDLSFDSPAANLACDEILLDRCESGAEDEILRFWESTTYFVVAGYANSVAKEVNLEACEADEIPVLRRISGGGTVLQGPGCLNYTVILRIPESGPLGSISGTNNTILRKLVVALEPVIGRKVNIKGQTDLTLGDLKFSGNAQRRKKHCLIFHGTFLMNFNIPLIDKYLRMPSKEPDYRLHRGHGEFLTNLTVEVEALKEAIQKEWQATEPLSELPVEKISQLAEEKYSSQDWNLKF